MSSTRRGHSTPFFELLAHPRHEPAHAQQVVHELRKGLGAIFVAFGEVGTHASLELALELVAILHRLGRLRRLKDGVANVDRVAKEDAGERSGDDQRNPGAADRAGRDLSRRAATEVRAADEDVSLPDLGGPGVAAGHAFHGVLAELLLVEGIDRVLGRDDLVGVDVIAELPNATANDFGQCHGFGSASTAGRRGDHGLNTTNTPTAMAHAASSSRTNAPITRRRRLGKNPGPATAGGGTSMLFGANSNAF